MDILSLKQLWDIQFKMTNRQAVGDVPNAYDWRQGSQLRKGLGRRGDGREEPCALAWSNTLVVLCLVLGLIFYECNNKLEHVQ